MDKAKTEDPNGDGKRGIAQEAENANQKSGIS